MAKSEKYRITFKALDDSPCEVSFWYEGFVGSVTILTGAARPFILGEYNTDEDLFKPMRPQLATINIVANSSGVSIDNFLANNDTDIDVYFKYNSAFTYYWFGSLLQDDFQETWINTEHIITLRASERFGYLKEENLASNTGAELSGTYTMIDFIKYAMRSTVQDFDEYVVINNLFHDSMTTSNTYHPLDQCKTDAKTFQVEAQTYDTSYNVIEKINRAFNQTIFMYNSNWFIMRLEELYIPTTENLRGVNINAISGRTLINKRYDINVGIGQEVQPISPEMLRFIRRRTKKDTVQFNYDQWDEILCNQTFQRGNNTLNTPTLKEFDVNNWTYYAGTINSPTTPTSGAVKRAETYDANGDLIDNYVYLPINNSENRYLKSCGTPVLSGETFKLGVDIKYKIDPTGGAFNDIQYYIILDGVTNNYTLDKDGIWYQSNSTWSTNVKSISVYFDGTDAPKSIEWNTVEVESTPIPETGTLYILLWGSTNTYSVGQERWFKSIEFKLNSRFNGFNDKTIKAIQSIFTKTADVKNNFDTDIFLDDGISRVYKGTIYESDGVTPTDKKWFRYRFDDERNGFRKSNAIAHWEHNRFNRNKIDANFYGLQWSDGATMRPIGLMNTIRFVDDDPNKTYAILNLKEIDFSSNTWSATLIEVYDDDKDLSGTVNYTLTANAEPGVHNGVTYLPLELTSPAQFSISNGDQLVYDGSTQITVNIACTIEGDINDVVSTPYDAYIYLKKNGSTISSDFINVTTEPTAFSYDLSVNAVVLNPGDILSLQLANRIVEIDVIDSNLSFTYSVSGALTYDPYEDKYIYK